VTLIWIDAQLLGELECAAMASPRKRQHLNLHLDYSDPAQRLLNRIERDSYIRPHRHQSAGSDETLVALVGVFGIVTFSDERTIDEVGLIGSERYSGDGCCPVGIVIEPGVWHSVLALTSGAVLLECKAGPFNPDVAKDFAHWAPEEGTAAAVLFLQQLRERCLADIPPRLRTAFSEAMPVGN